MTTATRTRPAGIDYELVFKLMPGMRLATAYVAAISGWRDPMTTETRSRPAGIDYELVFKLMPGMRLATAYAAAIAGGAIP